jgi:hypothetical protein
MTAFWTDPTALFWTDPSALFWASTAPWTESWLGGIGSFDSESDTYTVGGSGFGVASNADSLCFVSQAATGNIEIVSYISEQSSSDAYAIAGLMLRDSLDGNDAQCALIGVSPQNGVNFSWRTADGDAAGLQLGPSIATPIWLKLVVSQTSVAGFASADSIDWGLIGQTTISLPTDFYVGFAVSSNSSSAFNNATFSNLTYLTNVVQRSANLISWLRADVGVNYDADTSSVDLWDDQSSNGYSCSQNTSENQPTLVTNAINGLPAVEFAGSGSGQFLQFPEGFNFTDGLSLFIVLNPTSMAAGETVLDFRNFTGGVSSDQFGLSEFNSSGGVEFYAYDGTAGSSGQFSSALAADEFQLLEAIYDGVSSVSLYTNGTLDGTQDGLETLADVTRSENFMGQAGDGGGYFTGQIAEVLIFNTNLSEGSREAVEGYLLAKYSL